MCKFVWIALLALIYLPPGNPAQAHAAQEVQSGEAAENHSDAPAKSSTASASGPITSEYGVPAASVTGVVPAAKVATGVLPLAMPPEIFCSATGKASSVIVTEYVPAVVEVKFVFRADDGTDDGVAGV